MSEIPPKEGSPKRAQAWRLAVPLIGAAVLLAFALGALRGPLHQERPVNEGPSSSPAHPTSEAPRAQAARQPPRTPAASTAPQAAAEHESLHATVVPVGPEDEIPSAESPNPLPQVNDPIEPEKPQTARWRLGKTERITELLDRDVRRLELERDAAVARGDAAERQRLDILIRREQSRLTHLREDLVKLAAQAAVEPPEP
ncbi:hypothetical protein POL68_21025 [Stigmatella sp. ncwal1]|uniref:Secreted protein n=1 Tax=Stigmatella ashevillensis TaxID=2995309 RepID=A0ABT5DCX2_9BACT|nr:hypothetical protein [Stigmatella ashevillena]MDC0710968.1 hypothetical protein [Stigmatella ashevillena]